MRARRVVVKECAPRAHRDNFSSHDANTYHVDLPLARLG